MRRLLCVLLVAPALIVVPSVLAPVPSVASEDGVVMEVPEGADIQAAVDAAGPGATLQLQGFYTVTSSIQPLDGQTFLGPATLVGQGVTLIFRNTGAGVTYDGLDISGATGTRASAIQLGVGGTVINSVLHDNGWNGVRGQFHDGPANIKLIDVELYGNGFDPEALSPGAGGYKFLNGDGLETIRVYSHDNIGSGGWLDQDWRTFTSTDDVYVRNTKRGLFYEVSLGPAVIRNVTARDNGGTGVQVNSSDNVRVTGAVVGGNANGRGVSAVDIYDLRTDEYKRHLSDVKFETSTFTLNGDRVLGCELSGVSCDGIWSLVSVQVVGGGAGSVTSSPPGISCGTTCLSWFEEGTTVVLTAAPDPGTEFVAWEGAGVDCADPGPCELMAVGEVYVDATFLTLESLTVTVVENSRHGSVTSSPAGIDCGQTCVATFLHGTEVELTASPELDSAVQWTGCTPSSSDPLRCTVTLDGPKEVTTTIDPAPKTLTVSTAGSGTVTSTPVGISCPDSCEATFDHGAQVSLSAVPAPDWVFVGWSGACEGTDPCTVTMDQARSVEARFGEAPRTLSVTASGTGVVTSTPDGISCGEVCSAEFAHGTEVTLSATPGDNQLFTGWSGDCTGTGTCTLVMDQARSVGATFEPVARLLSVSTAGTGTGTVTSSPEGIACGLGCSASFPHGAEVTLSATPDPGSVFTGWSGDCTGTATCVITMDADRSASATFEPGPTSVTLADGHPSIAYGGWQGVEDAAASEGSYRVSAKKSEVATWVSPAATSITWIARTGPDRGKASVTIDGASKGTIDLYASSPGSLSTTFGGLTNSTHTVVVKVLGQKRAASSGTSVTVDAFAAASVTHEDTHASIAYGPWTGSSQAAATDGAFRSTATKNATAIVTFSGTRIDWVAALGPNLGKASVTIDGVSKGTVDLYAPSATWQHVITYGGLSSGSHTMTIKALGQKRAAATGTTVVIDGFVVHP